MSSIDRVLTSVRALTEVDWEQRRGRHARGPRRRRAAVFELPHFSILLARVAIGQVGGDRSSHASAHAIGTGIR